MTEAQNIFANSRMNITVEGKRHLGASIRSTEYRDKYVKDSVKDWGNQLPFCQVLQNTTVCSLLSICQ